MARIYNCGLAGSQSPTYGISHANITDKLTKDNFFDKAIVRGGDYIWIIKAKKQGWKNPLKCRDKRVSRLPIL